MNSCIKDFCRDLVKKLNPIQNQLPCS